MLDAFVKVLKYPMTFTQGRLRTRFVNLIQPKIDEREKNRLEICEKLCLRDEKDEPIIKEDTYQFPEGSTYQAEIDSLYGEEVMIDVPSSMRSDIGGLKHMIELSTVVLTPIEQLVAEYVLAVLEGEHNIPDPEPLPPPDNENGGALIPN